jgi:hypothetical protein
MLFFIVCIIPYKEDLEGFGDFNTGEQVIHTEIHR